MLSLLLLPSPTLFLILFLSKLSLPVSKMKLLLVKENHLFVPQALAMVTQIQVKKYSERREMPLLHVAMLPHALLTLMNSSLFSEMTVSKRKMVPTTLM